MVYVVNTLLMKRLRWVLEFHTSCPSIRALLGLADYNFGTRK